MNVINDCSGEGRGCFLVNSPALMLALADCTSDDEEEHDRENNEQNKH